MCEKETVEDFASQKGYILDYLTCGSPIFQVKDLYRFTSDSIELAHFVREDNIQRLVDLCSGSGVVGLEVAGEKRIKELYLVELQKDLADASKDSAKLNSGDTKIEVINQNVCGVSQWIGENSVDVVTVNPPYFKVGSGDIPSNESRAMARHELKLSLDELIQEAQKLLKTDGTLYMIHVDSRKGEIVKVLTKYGFIITDEKLLDGKLKRIIIRAEKH